MGTVDDFRFAAVFPSSQAEWTNEAAPATSTLGIAMGEAGNPAEKGNQQECANDHE